MSVRKHIGALLELAVMTVFVLVVLRDERRAAQRDELIRRAL